MFLSLALMSFFYLGVWGLINENLRAVTLSGIFTSFIIGSVVFSKMEIFKLNESWRQACLWFTIGFFLYMSITFVTSGREIYSLFSMPGSGLFATLSDSLPVFWEFFINSITIPVAEEALWLIALPITIYTVMNEIGKTYSFFKNAIFQILVACIIGSITFAIFHVGKFFITFIIAAMLFRTTFIFLVWADIKDDLIPAVTIVPALALGAHMGNNWGQVGFIQGLNVLITADGYLKLFGIFIALFFALIFATALDTILLKVFKISVTGDTK